MSQFSGSEESKYLNDSTRRQKELIESIPDEKIPSPPPGAFEQAAQPATPATPTGTAEAPEGVTLTQSIVVPPEMDERQILFDISNILRGMDQFLRQRMSDGA